MPLPRTSAARHARPDYSRTTRATGRVALGAGPGRAQRKGPTGGWVERARPGAVPRDRTRPPPPDVVHDQSELTNDRRRATQAATRTPAAARGAARQPRTPTRSAARHP